MTSPIVYLSDGEINTISEGKTLRLDSQREQKYYQTLRELEERHEWKSSGTGAKFMGQTNRYAGLPDSTRCHITALACWQGQLLYALTTPEMGGLYLKDPLDNAAPEGFLLSEREMRIHDMDAWSSRVVFSADSAFGERHIALYQDGKGGYRTITQGDTRDSAPHLSRNSDDLYYASAGLARDQEGIVIATGPSSIFRMSLSSGVLEELLSDDAFDYLRPREAPDGSLYCIRRPYQTPKAPKGPGLIQRTKNVGSFFKGLGKIIKFIGDPESAQKAAASTLSGGAKAVQQQRSLEGVMLDVTIQPSDKEEKGCVPDSWVLLRQEADGTMTEIQRGVADYVFDGQTLIYSDGRRIFRCEGGKREKLAKGVFIPKLAVIEA